ncbi:hypothetical protein JTE90_029213 [Oedothorax gibbosus]|uniref:Uncharacterized protein n=1 Tax=Oedothorax gibbosus TaxID=931172 RepID=A0AAV6VC48_9ARAC|nr:hypothetical protein JTE90_029213 [Oedothorax gibbosus]
MHGKARGRLTCCLVEKQWEIGLPSEVGDCARNRPEEKFGEWFGGEKMTRLENGTMPTHLSPGNINPDALLECTKGVGEIDGAVESNGNEVTQARSVIAQKRASKRN